MTQLDLEELILSVGDFPVNHSVINHKREKAQKMIAFYGEKCLRLHKRSGVIGLLERMLLVLSIWDVTKFYHSWKIMVTPQGSFVFQLQRRVQITNEIDCGLLPTPIAHLSQEVGNAGDWGRATCLTTRILDLENMHLQRGKVKPEFIESMMGYPQGWTALDEED